MVHERCFLKFTQYKNLGPPVGSTNETNQRCKPCDKAIDVSSPRKISVDDDTQKEVLTYNLNIRTVAFQETLSHASGVSAIAVNFVLETLRPC